MQKVDVSVWMLYDKLGLGNYRMGREMRVFFSVLKALSYSAI